MRTILLVISLVFLGCQASDPAIIENLQAYERASRQGDAVTIGKLSSGISGEMLRRSGVTGVRPSRLQILRYGEAYYTWFGKATVPVVMESKDTTGRPVLKLAMKAKMEKIDGTWKVKNFELP